MSHSHNFQYFIPKIFNEDDLFRKIEGNSECLCTFVKLWCARREAAFGKD